MEHAKDQLVDGIFARPTQSQAGESHADLRDREQTRRIGQQIQRGLRAHLALIGQRSQPALANRDQRHFRRREEAVERQDDGQDQ